MDFILFLSGLTSGIVLSGLGVAWYVFKVSKVEKEKKAQDEKELQEVLDSFFDGLNLEGEEKEKPKFTIIKDEDDEDKE